MVSRKRNHSEAGVAPKQPPEEPGLLHRLRNSWEFANLMQYISMFGKLMKIDENFGIEVCPALCYCGFAQVNIQTVNTNTLTL